MTGLVPPVATSESRVTALQHPRLVADPAHRGLRDAAIAACRSSCD